MRQIMVSRHHRFIHQWQAVKIVIELVESTQGSTENETWFVMPTGIFPLIKIYDPLGVELFTYSNMIYVSDGHYQFTYQTTDLNPLGVYTATIIAVKENISLPDNSEYARLEKIPVFKIIKEAEMPAGYVAVPPDDEVDPDTILGALVAYYAFEGAIA